MRPAHAHHRVLKDSTTSQSILPSASNFTSIPPSISINKNNKTPQSLPKIPNQTPLILPSNSSAISLKIARSQSGIEYDNSASAPQFSKPGQDASQQQTLQNLIKKIKDLEKEKYQQSHHIQQAEVTLKNYRELLLAFNITIPENISEFLSDKKKVEQEVAKTFSPEGKSKTDSSELALKLAEERVEEAKKESLKYKNELEELKKKLIEVENNNKNLMENNLKNEQLLHEKDIKINRLESENDRLEKLVEAISSPVTPSSISSQPSPIKEIKNDEEEVVQNQVELDQSLLKSLIKLKFDNFVVLKNELNEIKNELNNFFLQFLKTSLSKKFDEFIFNYNKKMKEFLVYKLEKETEIKKLNEKLSFYEEKEVKNFQDIMCSPIKFNNTTSSSTSTSPISSPPVSNLSIISPTKFESLMKEKETLAAKNLNHEINYSTLNLKYDTEKKKNSISKIIFTELQSNLLKFYDLVAGEIKAIKHVAHIKELQRVAKERDQAIEKDRMLLELKYFKEVQNILLFSLKTAEQSLTESHPQVVEKLVEGRSKRLKLLDSGHKSKLKDVDQRSSETNAVSSSHLETFMKKAEENLKNNEEMVKKIKEEINTIIQRYPLSD